MIVCVSEVHTRRRRRNCKPLWLELQPPTPVSRHTHAHHACMRGTPADLDQIAHLWLVCTLWPMGEVTLGQSQWRNKGELLNGRTCLYFYVLIQTIWPKLFADIQWQCMLWLVLLTVPKSPHRRAAAQVMACTTTLAPRAYTHMQLPHISCCQFKRQPEKKDALLMSRGPCSEKARRGLQSCENPARHKQKWRKRGRGKKTKK